MSVFGAKPCPVLRRAELPGIGRYIWPGVGFAGSNGGARMIDLGIEDTGGELRTSVCGTSAIIINTPGEAPTYPAGVRIHESPPNSVCPDLFHTTTAVQEDGQHALSQINDLLILFCAGRVRGIVGHGVLLRDGRDDQGGVKSGESLAERGKLGVSSPYNKLLYPGHSQQELPRYDFEL